MIRNPKTDVEWLELRRLAHAVNIDPLAVEDVEYETTLHELALQVPYTTHELASLVLVCVACGEPDTAKAQAYEFARAGVNGIRFHSVAILALEKFRIPTEECQS